MAGRTMWLGGWWSSCMIRSPRSLFDGVDTPFAEEGREPALFREHRLALMRVVSAVPADEVPDDGVHPGGILRPMDLHAVGRGVAFEFTEVVAQAAQRVV